MKRQYMEANFRPKSLEMIAQANEIIDVYAAQGYDLTLRQLYYQFVSRDLIPNRQSEYKRLGSVVNDGRLAGLIDWDAIVDRTRSLRGASHWESPSRIIRGAANSYRIDKWSDQPYRVEVWIEKDALVGVIEGICTSLDVDYFSCRGYTSQSEMWSASQRLLNYIEEGQSVKIVHLGDHDPSGIDMSRDIEDRLRMFLHGDYGRVDNTFSLDRVALNRDQIDQYQPPPNPAKITDSRAAGYIAEHGRQSWELDALEPTVLSALIETAVLDVRDEDAWNERVEEEEADRKGLRLAADNWPDVAEYLRGNFED